jgi:hypothetical protein
VNERFEIGWLTGVILSRNVGDDDPAWLIDMDGRFSNDGSKETTMAHLCIGNCVPKAIVARKKRSIGISHAYALLVRDPSRGIRCLPDRWSVYQLGVPPGFFCGNR